MDIIVFSNSNCRFCLQQKEWMSENKITFQEKNIINPEHYEEFLKHNVQGVPLTIIKSGDRVQKIRGFNEKELKKIFNLTSGQGYY